MGVTATYRRTAHRRAPIACERPAAYGDGARQPARRRDDAASPRSHQVRDADSPQPHEAHDGASPRPHEAHDGDTGVPADHATSAGSVQQATTSGQVDDPLEALVEELAELDLDALDEPAIRAQLDRAQRAIVRLTAFRTRAAGELERRALRVAGPGREQQALQGSRRRLADDLRLTPTQAKEAGETGRRISELPAAQSAMNEGKLPPEHARILADTLRWFSPELREQAEAELLEAARREDARTFGRSCRRLLARLDCENAQKAQDNRNSRRSLKMTDTPDGMLAVHANGSGLDAEFVYSAVQAFRRPDAPGERRTTDQRSWDALVEACRAALDAGTAPSRQSVRPHVLVLVEEPTIRRDGGVAEAGWMGPLPWPEVRRILSDCDVSRVVLDGDRLPLEAGEAVRSVPAGLRKALQVRDGTCAGDGCDVPAMWCQVMHLDTPYRLQGRLRLDTAAPGCNYHHRMLDRHGWKVTWVDGRPVVHHPDHPPRAPDP